MNSIIKWAKDMGLKYPDYSSCHSLHLVGIKSIAIANVHTFLYFSADVKTR